MWYPIKTTLIQFPEKGFNDKVSSLALSNTSWHYKRRSCLINSPSFTHRKGLCRSQEYVLKTVRLALNCLTQRNCLLYIWELFVYTNIHCHTKKRKPLTVSGKPFDELNIKQDRFNLGCKTEPRFQPRWNDCESKMGCQSTTDL